MYKRLLGAALVFGMAATAPPNAAEAQTLCADRASVIGKLENKHGESAIGVGLSGPHAAFEIWRAQRTGTWTITITRLNNMTCILASGSHWLDGKNDPPKDARPASATR